ncbi:MAG TPA: YbhB/YbcL family Raf kinase inhibitor-like protein [Anaerolineaceae bacterium]
MPLALVSNSFTNGGLIPPQYTIDGENRSPLLRWSALPQGTRSLALIMEDPDAPRGTFVHWVIYNLPNTSRELPEAISKSPTIRDLATQGMNDFRKLGYDGPLPPPGKLHGYVFHLYALSLEPNLPPGLTAAQLREKMQNKILEEAQYVGRFQRY